MKRPLTFLRLISTWVLLGVATSHAAVTERHPTPAAIVAEVLSAPDGKIDFARAKLTFDRIIDPSIKMAQVASELDKMTRTVIEMAGPHATDQQKLLALRKLIYVSGPWNDNRPFDYDHNDPLGQNIENKLLSTYLRTRRGNCLSMPALYLILADRMGLNVSLAAAPLHEFVRYTDAAGHTMNLETTSGAYPARDSWMRRQAPMSDRAVESGLYLRTLTRRESLGLMAETVAEYLLSVGRNEDAIEVADVIVKYDARNGVAMIQQAAGYAQIIAVEFKSKYAHTNLIPAPLLPRYLALSAHEDEAYYAATALGWEPCTDPAAVLARNGEPQR